MNNKIREIRKYRNLTQKEVADRMTVLVNRKITKGTIGAWERGDREINLVDACALADIFECSLDELAGKKQNKNLSQAESTLLHSYRAADAHVRAAMEAIASVQRKQLKGVIHMPAPVGRDKYRVIKKQLHG